jgi:hypothetical protein
LSTAAEPGIHLPPGWLPGCLLLWGAAGEQVPQALLAALLLMALGRSFVRWELSTRHFERLSDLCAIAFATLALYLFNGHGVLAIYRILLAFPWVLLPLTLAQLAATAEGVPLGALAMSRRVRAGAVTDVIDLRPVLGGVCLVAASAGALTATQYAAGTGLLLASLIVANRGTAHGRWRSVAALLTTVVLSSGVYLGLQRAQLASADAMQALIARLGLRHSQVDTTYTAIGALGRLKLSDRIVLRIEGTRDVPLPIRLVEARFQQFDNGIWRNPRQPLVALDAIPGARAWQLAATPARRAMILTGHRRSELGALALPAGTTRISGDKLLELQRHPSGAILAEARPGYLRYTADYTPSNAGPALALPTAADRQVPTAYRPLLAGIAGRIGADGRDARAGLAAITAYFARDFRYSLVLPGYHPGRLPLATFLTRSRAGHCEYFATATTLLLRQAGIPARYVVGYLVDEYSPLEQAFLARARHAHAWAEAFVEGAWVTVDTTPGQWLDLESAAASHWQLVTDAIDWLRLRLYRLQEAPPLPGPLALLAVPVLLAWLGWRLRHLARARAPAGPRAAPTIPSTLAPLYARLAARGLRPRTSDTPLAFLASHWPASSAAALRRLVLRHYVLRFGAAPTGSDSSAAITRDAHALLAAEADTGARQRRDAATAEDA